MKIRLLFCFFLLFLSTIADTLADASCDADSLGKNFSDETQIQEVNDLCCEESDCSTAPTFCDFMENVFLPRDCNCYPLGFYVGTSVNYEHFWGQHEDFVGDFSLSNGRQKFQDDSVSVTLYFGYLCEIPCFENVVIGFEPYISVYNYNKYSSTATNTLFIIAEELENSLRRRIHGGVLFRLGYVFPCNFLIYGVVGPDIARFEFIDKEIFTGTSEDTSRNMCGVVYGFGVEKPLSWCNIILGLQATVTQYGSHTLTISSPASTSTSVIRPKVFDLSLRLSVPLN